MNIRRVTSSTTLALVLVASTSPAWSADGDPSAGGATLSGGNSGIASQLGRDSARNPQPTTGALSSPRAGTSWSHDSHIPTQLTRPTPGTSWSHDSRIPTQLTRPTPPR